MWDFGLTVKKMDQVKHYRDFEVQKHLKWGFGVGEDSLKNQVEMKGLRT